MSYISLLPTASTGGVLNGMGTVVIVLQSVSIGCVTRHVSSTTKLSSTTVVLM